jgi:hypothetical protein
MLSAKTTNRARRWLILSYSSPVLYGIKSSRLNVCFPVASDIIGEIGLKGGAQPGEIKVIFVPQERVEFVKTLLSEGGNFNIAVELFDFGSS